MTEPQRFRKKPIEIEAICFDGTNYAEIETFTGGAFEPVAPADRGDDPEVVATVFNPRYGARIPVKVGMWIARDAHGFFPVKAEVLNDAYEAVGTAKAHPFAWGQSVSRDGQRITVPLQQGDDWTAEMHIGAGDAVVLADMLTDAAIDIVEASDSVTVAPPAASKEGGRG